MPDTIAKHPPVRIETAILVIRGEKVMLDADLATLYGVETKVLIQAVKRNLDRFPADFMFQLTKDEFDRLRDQVDVQGLRSQIVTSRSGGRGGRRYPPYAFTEQGVAMLSSVLRSPRAVAVNIEIMRTFVHLRQMLLSHEELARKLDALEERYDSQFKVIFDALRALMAPKVKEKRRMGFRAEEGGKTTKDAKSTKGRGAVGAVPSGISNAVFDRLRLCERRREAETQRGGGPGEGVNGGQPRWGRGLEGNRSTQRRQGAKTQRGVDPTRDMGGVGGGWIRLGAAAGE